MKFGFMSEGETRPGSSYRHRYQELEAEVVFAEQMGFDFFACSEQHFTLGASISAPECLFSYLFAKTTRMRFRHAVMLLPHNINHPLRVAERIATEDILSNGRVELGTGRANTPLIIRAFQVDPDRSRREWLEAVRVIQAAFGPQPFEYSGEFVQIPKRYMVPLPVQQPFPPMSVAATSPDSMALAAENGLGVMTGSYFFGWQWLETLMSEYFKARDGLATAEVLGNPPGLSVLAYTYCAETDEQARGEGFESLYNAARLGSLAFTRLAEMSKSYGYMAQAAEIAEKLTDPYWLIEESGSVICGSPETCATQIARYIDMGASEVIIRIDGPGHRKVMQSLELLGKYVLPKFTSGYAFPPEGLVAGGIT